MKFAPLIVLLFACAALSHAYAAEAPACGMNAKDWCHASPADPCDRYPDVESCRSDPACYGVPFKGESFAACITDKRGFSSNCPTVGCTSRLVDNHGK